MPRITKYVPPELFTIVAGIRVWNTYDFTGVESQYIFSTSEDEDDRSYMFDVRDILDRIDVPAIMFTRDDNLTSEGKKLIIRYGILQSVIPYPDNALDRIYYFDIEIVGRGTNANDAWNDAVERFCQNPGTTPKEYEYRTKYIDE